MKVLVLRTVNSAGSQMAEGLLRSLSQGAVEVHSAGTHPSHVHPLAVEAMMSAPCKPGGQGVSIDVVGHTWKW